MLGGFGSNRYKIFIEALSDFLIIQTLRQCWQCESVKKKIIKDLWIQSCLLEYYI